MPEYRKLTIPSGMFVVFDPGRTFPVMGTTPEDFQNWFDERALVTWVEDPDRFEIRHVFGPIPAEVGSAGLLVTSGAVFIGSATGLFDVEPRHDAGFTVNLPHGPYNVGVTADGPGQFTIYLEHLVAFDKPPGNGELAPHWWDPHALAWSPPAPAEHPVPLVTQLGIDPAMLTLGLSAIGRATRAARDLDPTLPLLVREHSIDRLPMDAPCPRPAPHCLVLAEDHPWMTALVRLPHRFPGHPAGAHVHYVGFLHSQRLVVRISRDGDVLRDAVPLTRDPQSANDQAECLRLVQAGYDTGRSLPVGIPSGPVAIEQVWSLDCLTVRVGPVPRDRVPSIRVHFQAASGMVIETTEPPPVRHRNGCWEFELWLLGHRRGLTEAHVEVQTAG